MTTLKWEDDSADPKDSMYLFTTETVNAKWGDKVHV